MIATMNGGVNVDFGDFDWSGDLGYRDAYRSLHGYGSREPSWTWQRIAGHGGGWRLDHLFTSAELWPAACVYHHAWRNEGLSDHSALEAAIVRKE